MKVKELKECLVKISNKSEKVMVRQLDYKIISIADIIPLSTIIRTSDDETTLTVAELYIRLLEHVDEAEVLIKQTDDSVVFLADVVPAFAEESFVCLIGSKTPSSYLHHYT